MKSRATRAANKGPFAELPERRSLPKGNSQDPDTHHAQKWARVHQGIARIREFVEQNPKEKLTTLLHHINADSLKASYFALKQDASPRVDGITWEAYNADLDTRIADLCTRVHRWWRWESVMGSGSGSMHACTPWDVSGDTEQVGKHTQA